MAQTMTPEEFLAQSTIDPAVAELRPDYRVLLMVAEGLDPESGAEVADCLVAQAEAHARVLLAESPAEELPHIASWRDAYRAFGAKPQRTRNSLEALTRRAPGGLPRINPLADIYNAISVLYQLPLGGEDFAMYQGPARVIRSAGDEPFETVAHGEVIVENPIEGEVVWRDDIGVTCRRWNWRQGPRTGLSDQTETALFILDALDPVTDEELTAAGNALAEALLELGGDVQIHRRLLGA